MEKARLKELLRKMSLEDKILQLLQISGGSFETKDVLTGPNAMYGLDENTVYNVGSVINSVGAEKMKRIQSEYLEKSRHKIPLLFMSDIIYGLRTIFPIPLGSACSWDMEQIQHSAEISAKESAVSGQQVTFSPMVDLVRDPRWGRVLESPGEDTYYNCQYAKAYVRGLQGEDSGENGIDVHNHIASCVKHFAAYGASEAGREYNTVDVSKRRLYESYFPPYKAAVDSGAKLVMTSFNTVDGIPSSGNKWLNRKVLREEWGFEGVLISDASSIEELVAHGVAGDKKEAARMALEAGVDIDMMSPVYVKNLKELAEEDAVLEALIDEAAWRILTLKNQLGLFENPFGGADALRERELILCEEHRKAARRLADDSCVLLKNNGLLPLDTKKKKIALIGPYADNGKMLGVWAIHGSSEDTVTVRKGLENLICETGADIRIKTARGSRFVRDTAKIQSFGSIFELENESGLNEERLMEEALEVAADADVIILALGEHFLQSGEGGSRGDIRLPGCQRELFDRIIRTGKPTVVLLFGGRPMDVRDLNERADALLMCWFPGSEGGNAVADLLFGKVNPSAKLTMSFPYSVGQVPVYYNAYNTGRPYKPEFENTRFGSKYTDIPNDPLFPFGYGLSYTSFSYEEMRLSADQMHRGEMICASCTVKNTGDLPGKETVQLYIQDKVGSVVRPVKELKGFKKIFLEPGESKRVFFEIDEEMLKFYTEKDRFEAEKGEFILYIGRNSKECLEKSFRLI